VWWYDDGQSGCWICDLVVVVVVWGHERERVEDSV